MLQHLCTPGRTRVVQGKADVLLVSTVRETCLLTRSLQSATNPCVVKIRLPRFREDIITFNQVISLSGLNDVGDYGRKRYAPVFACLCCLHSLFKFAYVANVNLIGAYVRKLKMEYLFR